MPSHDDLDQHFDENGQLDIESMRVSLDAEMQQLDKFQVINSRFIDTIHGYFAGNHITTTIDNARAVCSLMADFATHLERKGHLPNDFELTFDSRASDQDPHKRVKQASNFAKHAQNDAHKTFWYGNSVEVQIFMGTMIKDYETLHCTLMTTNLLETRFEQLHKVDASILSRISPYHSLYDPYEKTLREAKPVGHTEEGRPCYQFSIEQEKQMTGKHAYMPAAVIAHQLFEKWSIHARLNNTEESITSMRKNAKEMESLGIWPVNIKANAMMTRNPEITTRIHTLK